MLVFIHVLALVFWLGTDIGVFVMGKFAQNPVYTVDQRLLLLKVALILDVFPRICMIIIVPTGYQLAVHIGAISPGSYLTPGVWLFSLIWLAIVVTGMTQGEKALGLQAKAAQKWIYYFLLILGLWAGLGSLYSNAPIGMHWLELKVLFYVLIIVFVLFLERVFNPVAEAFMKLAIEGSSPDLESQIRKGMDKTYVWVILIYVCVVFSAYFGISQPQF